MRSTARKAPSCIPLWSAESALLPPARIGVRRVLLREMSVLGLRHLSEVADLHGGREGFDVAVRRGGWSGVVVLLEDFEVL